MKKYLLLTLSLTMIIVSFGQVAQLKQQALFSTVAKANMHAEDALPLLPANPYVANRGVDEVVGTTWYDLQSNSSISKRIWVFDDGTAAAVWTRGAETGVPNFAGRGTGYNYFDGTSWGTDPSSRIEDVRTGWPSIAPYGADGEIVVAHTLNNTGLMFSWREHKGTGDWQHFTLAGPAPDNMDLTWARMITTGVNHDVIHIIACAGFNKTYEGLNEALVYSRSNDGGQTWDPENEILPGMSSDETSGIGGDDYAWAIPRGDTIAFVAFDGIKDGYVMKSYDGGDTWEKITFYNSPMPFFTGNEGTLPRCGGGDGYNAVALDDEGKVHVAFGRQIHIDDDPADGYSYYPYSDGLVYWNEDMDPLDTANITNDIIPDNWENHPLYLNGQLAAWTQPHENDTIVGVAPYYASLTSMPQISVKRDINGVNIVTVIYSALAVGFSNAELNQNYRHIWERNTELNGQNIWGQFFDHTGDVLHLFSECVYPSEYPVNHINSSDTLHVLYQSDNLPGNSIQPTGGNHAPVNNNLVHLLIFPQPVGVPNFTNPVFEISQNRPNPANGQTIIDVNTMCAGTLQLSVVNLLGQQVYTDRKVVNSTGIFSFKVDVSALNTGVYFYKITEGNSSVTKKMIVR